MGRVDFLKDWYRQVWTDGNMAAIDRYFAPRSVANGLVADGQVKAEDFKALVPALRSLVRDIEVTVDRSIEAGDWLWAQITVRALTAHGIDRVEASGQVMMLVEDGVITEAYNCFDFVTFFEQSGLLPQDAFMLLLSGEKLG
jgi:hypothetical protein